MVEEQPDVPPTEEIECRGALTLEHYYEVRKLTRQREAVILYNVVLAILFLTTGVSAWESFSLDIVSENLLPLISFLASTALVVWRLKQLSESRKLLKKNAAEKNGWFSEQHVSISNKGFSYNIDTQVERYSGFSPWSSFSQSKSTDSLIILYHREIPDNYVVLVREFFSSEIDWQKFLTLVERHAPPLP